MVSPMDAQICLHMLKTWARERVECRLAVMVVARFDIFVCEPQYSTREPFFWYIRDSRGESDEHRVEEVLDLIRDATAVIVPSGKGEM